MRPGRINRNIVECKVILGFRQPRVLIGINRNIVECKDQKAKYFQSR